MSQDKTELISFELKNGKLEIDTDALQQIHQAVLVFFSLPDDEFPAAYLLQRALFKQEIETSHPSISGQVARIHGWLLEERDGELELIRHPDMPRPPAFYTFNLKLKLQGAGWQVDSMYHVRHFGLRE